MRVTIANISKTIQQPEFQAALQAISKQCNEDFQPEWNISCVIRGTQADSYQMDGIAVSNFVTPGYFGLTGGSPTTNFQKLDLKPFGVRPGGYFQFEDGNHVFQVNGERVKAEIAEREEARKRMALGRRNTRRD